MGTFLSEYEAYAILKEHRIPVLAHCLAHNAEEAANAARRIGYPVAMKIASRVIVHKTDAGCVALDVASETEAREAYFRIIANAKKAAPGHDLPDVLVTPMVSGGTEVIVGAGVDAEFGRYVMCGMGGTQAELFKDVAFRIAPLNKCDAMEMIRETHVGTLLDGWRGSPPADTEALCGLLLEVGRMMTAREDITELDLNPVCVKPSGVFVLDARIRLE